MSISRREFMQMMAVAGIAGFLSPRFAQAAGKSAEDFYEIPDYGNVTLLHFTDCHAQLNPVYWREPDTNIGVGAAIGRPPHLTGEHFLKFYHEMAGTQDAYAFDCLDYAELAQKYGKMGGFAHLTSLIKRYRDERKDRTLLLDAGDTWQGSATSLYTKGADMVGAQNLMGVDAMVGHWEFTYGQKRVKELVDKHLKAEFLAQNINDSTWGDLVFKPYMIRVVSGRRIAIIGQAFPYTPIANPRYMIPDWTFGIKQDHMQKMVDECRHKENADLVVVLSHNGADVDMKMAANVKGIDIILGGHTHDIMGPRPVKIGKTLVINTSTNGKILARFDLDVGKGRLKGYRFHYMPVFSNLLKPDAEMAAYIEKVRAPYVKKLSEPLAVTESLLYRRDNFNGTFDQLLVQALMEEMDAEAAFSPGFRWGYAKLPGETITFDDVMGQTAITYPQVTINEYTGKTIKMIMEDVGDNLFNKDPYYQQGGDMIRVGNIQYVMDPNKKIGHRIKELHVGGKPISMNKKYKVAGWAAVSRPVEGKPVWDVFADWLRKQKHVRVDKLDVPRLVGVKDNPGIAFPKEYGL
ncbi:thiosulfohydrolase SoxB [Acidihalobacter aeolianus]|uniref:Thiosulfohydrolase SoxB n=1 Tax=Acidihalobacter aeolianus TaxID=2792603 RepID=A0A1D8K9T0_9GAMM|nr:thiosulfohydrolase SoxB [Acidihalobacter aeolianus]AOV17712.1 thiosulfohydrolase SoxB [Acidihalobacter aeolianus]